MDASERTERPIAALLAPDILALLDEDPSSIAVETEEVHPADLADVVETLPASRIPDLLSALPAARAADVMEYLDEGVRTEALEAMSARDAATIVREMSPDDRADVLEEIQESRADEILAEIPADERILVICRSGQRSGRVTEALRRAGYDAANVVGGMLAWRDAGGSIEADGSSAPRIG